MVSFIKVMVFCVSDWKERGGVPQIGFIAKVVYVVVTVTIEDFE